MTRNVDICRICGEGHLTTQVEKVFVEYKGTRGELNSLYSVCNICGSEQANAEQIRTNKRLMIAFKKHVDGLLVGNEVRAIRERLKLTQAEAAQVFGGGPVAFSKYESDDVAQSEAMDKLLRLASELTPVYELLCRRAGLERGSAGEKWSQVETWGAAGLAHSSQPVRSKLRVVSSSTPNVSQQVQYAA